MSDANMHYSLSPRQLFVSLPVSLPTLISIGCDVVQHAAFESETGMRIVVSLDQLDVAPSSDAHPGCVLCDTLPTQLTRLLTQPRWSIVAAAAGRGSAHRIALLLPNLLACHSRVPTSLFRAARPLSLKVFRQGACPLSGAAERWVATMTVINREPGWRPAGRGHADGETREAHWCRIQPDSQAVCVTQPLTAQVQAVLTQSPSHFFWTTLPVYR